MNVIIFILPAPLLILLFINALNQDSHFSLLSGGVLLSIILAWGMQFTILSLNESPLQDGLKVLLFAFLYYVTWDYPPYDIIVLGAFLGTVMGTILNQFITFGSTQQ